jgi:hypothetical protein
MARGEADELHSDALPLMIRVDGKGRAHSVCLAARPVDERLQAQNLRCGRADNWFDLEPSPTPLTALTV